MASGDAVGVALGEGLGEPFFLLLFFVGEGELFGVGVAEGSGVCVGEAVGFGELVAFGVTLGFAVALGEALGLRDGVGVVELFFFVVLFRFFGGGVGSKMFLILSPNDCASARGGEAKLNPQITTTTTGKHPIAVIPSLRRPRGTSHRLLPRTLATSSPGVPCEILRRASPASG